MQSLSTWARAADVPFPSPSADDRLQAAYQATFAGNATREDAELVIVDLAVTTRFFEAMAPTASAEALRYVDGGRAVFRRLVGFIADPRILGELQVAALREAIVTETSQRKRT